LLELTGDLLQVQNGIPDFRFRPTLTGINNKKASNGNLQIDLAAMLSGGKLPLQKQCEMQKIKGKICSSSH
jgi:hypothetical protein